MECPKKNWNVMSSRRFKSNIVWSVPENRQKNNRWDMKAFHLVTTFFTKRVVNTWNELKDDIVESMTVYDRLQREWQYSFNWNRSMSMFKKLNIHFIGSMTVSWFIFLFLIEIKLVKNNYNDSISNLKQLSFGHVK